MAELVAPRLAAFIAAHVCLRWEPGQIDCCLFLADWARWIGHSDPAAHLRGKYNSEDGFRAIITAAGGVVPVVAECIANIGGQLINSPACGAVGVIGSRTHFNRQWGALYDGERWLVRSRDGIGPVVAQPLAVWKI
jgi:hypothetical protein